METTCILSLKKGSKMKSTKKLTNLFHVALREVVNPFPFTGNIDKRPSTGMPQFFVYGINYGSWKT